MLMRLAALALLAALVGGRKPKRSKRALPPPDLDANGDGWEDDAGWLAEAERASVARGGPPLGLPGRCDFARVPAEGLTAAAFAAEHVAGRRPALLEGLTEGWPAREAWAAPALLRAHGAHTVLHEEMSHVAQYGAGDANSGESTVSSDKQSTLRAALVRQRTAVAGSAAPFVFDKSASSIARSLLAAGDFSVPPVLGSVGAEELLLSLGAARGGLPMHAHGDTWLALTHGAKLWLTFEPGELPTRNVSISEQLLTRRLAVQNAATVLETAAADGELAALLSLEGLHVCVQQPGETVYLPSLWHHATANLGEAVGVGGQNSAWFLRLTAHHADLESALMAEPRSALLRTTVAAMQLQSLKNTPSKTVWVRTAAEILENNARAQALEPHNLQIYASNARMSYVLRLMGEAKGADTFAQLRIPSPSELLRRAAEIVMEVYSAGLFSPDEAAEHLCDLAIAACASQFTNTLRLS